MHNELIKTQLELSQKIDAITALFISTQTHNIDLASGDTEWGSRQLHIILTIDALDFPLLEKSLGDIKVLFSEYKILRLKEIDLLTAINKIEAHDPFAER